MTTRDDVTYSTAHARLRRVMRGPCAHCDTTRRPRQVALRKGFRLPGLRCSVNPRGSYGRLYSTDPEAYALLCGPCHRFLDKVIERWVETPLSRSRRFATN